MIFDLPRVEDTDLFTWLRMLVEQIELGTMDDEKVRKITSAIVDLTDAVKALQAALEAAQTNLTALSSRFRDLSDIDLNDIDATGLYYVSEVEHGAQGIGFGAVLHIQSTDGEYKKQFMSSEVLDNLYTRKFSENNWGQWTRIGG